MDKTTYSGGKRLFTALSPCSPNQEEKRAAIEKSTCLSDDTPGKAKHLQSTCIDLITKMSEIGSAVNESVNFAVKCAEEAVGPQEHGHNIKELEAEHANLKTELLATNGILLHLESYGRRDNPLLHGVPEKAGEDVGRVARESLEQAGIKLAEPTAIHKSVPHTTHQVHTRTHDEIDLLSPGSITLMTEWKCGWWKKKSLLPNLHLTEDYPQEIRRRRKILTPYLKKGKESKELRKSRMTEDRLIVNGKSYTVNTLDPLNSPRS